MKIESTYYIKSYENMSMTIDHSLTPRSSSSSMSSSIISGGGISYVSFRKYIGKKLIKDRATNCQMLLTPRYVQNAITCGWHTPEKLPVRAQIVDPTDLIWVGNIS